MDRYAIKAEKWRRDLFTVDEACERSEWPSGNEIVGHEATSRQWQLAQGRLGIVH